MRGKQHQRRRLHHHRPHISSAILSLFRPCFLRNAPQTRLLTISMHSFRSLDPPFSPHRLSKKHARAAHTRDGKYTTTIRPQRP